VNSFDTGISPYYYNCGECDGSAYLPSLIVTGDLNGDGYLDFALTGVHTNPNCSDCSQTNELQSWYYGNDAQANIPSSSLTPPPPPGTYSLSVNYPGNQLYQGGSAAAALPITIVPGSVSGLVSGPSSDIFGNNDTFTVTVNGAPGGAAPTVPWSCTVTEFRSDGEPVLGWRFDCNRLGDDLDPTCPRNRYHHGLLSGRRQLQPGLPHPPTSRSVLQPPQLTIRSPRSILALHPLRRRWALHHADRDSYRGLRRTHRSGLVLLHIYCQYLRALLLRLRYGAGRLEWRRYRECLCQGRGNCGDCAAYIPNRTATLTPRLRPALTCSP